MLPHYLSILGLRLLCSQLPLATIPKGFHMLSKLVNFFKNEDGAVTVDWVVLTALVVGLAVAAFASIMNGSTNVGTNIQNYLLSLVAGNI